MTAGANMINKEDTILLFGYDPTYLTKGSNKKVIVECECGIKQARYFFAACKGKGLCLSCRGRANNKRVKTQTPDGKRSRRKLYMREWRKDPVNNLQDRIRASLNKAFHRKGITKSRIGSFRRLDYTPEDLKAHLDIEQTKPCNICRLPLFGEIQISHYVAVKSAKTEEEIIERFALPNLGWAHAPCNNELRGKNIWLEAQALA